MRFLLSLLFFCSLMFASSPDLDNEFSTDLKEESLFDPLSGYNKIMTTFNDRVYEYVLKPTSQGYAYIVPLPLREGIANAADNLIFPVRFINNMLQLKFQNSMEELGRFLINSTLGVVGFVDIASSDYGLKQHSEDLGQTLGFYGVGSGFHIVIPLLGPSNLRDLFGIIGDSWANPMSYIEAREANLLGSYEEELLLKGFLSVNRTSLYYEEYDSFKKDAIDLYPFMRNLYESRRNKRISE